MVGKKAAKSSLDEIREAVKDKVHVTQKKAGRNQD